MARIDRESGNPTFSGVGRDTTRPHAEATGRPAIYQSKTAAARNDTPHSQYGRRTRFFPQPPISEDHDSEDDDDENSEEPEIRPRKKHRDISVRVIDLQDELAKKFTQTRQANFLSDRARATSIS